MTPNETTPAVPKNNRVQFTFDEQGNMSHRAYEDDALPKKGSIQFMFDGRGNMSQSVYGLEAFRNPETYESEQEPNFEQVTGSVREYVSPEAAQDIPDAVEDDSVLNGVKRVLQRAAGGIFGTPDGEFYYERPAVRNDFAMNPESMKAYKNIQDIARMTLADKDGKPREMDHEVAVIRAKLQSGEFTKEQAKEVAWKLRKSRDIQMAKRVAAQLTSEMARNGEWKPGDRGVTWRDVYVPTTKESLAKARTAGYKGVRDEINYMVDYALAKAEDMVDRDRMQRRIAYLAARHGLEPETVEREYDEDVVRTFDPNGTRGSWNDEAMAAAADFDALESAHRKNGMRRFYGQRGYPQELADLRNYINYVGNERFRKQWTGPVPQARYKIRRKRRETTGYYY